MESTDRKTKVIKKTKFPSDPEQDKRFDELKRKYANAIAYLLVKNVPRMGLRSFFEENDDNRRRFDTIKRFRAQIIESRPKAKIWIDKPFYIKLDLGQVKEPVEEGQMPTVNISLGECVFKQTTSVVTDRKDLEKYLETIAKIIESEKVWADPDMADFDTGEREYLAPEQK